ncbi:MAG: glycosyltransferase [Candidatus Omnitrophica bacterium]|jgi:glycosyltransferase involved in cell wall biosynthesis|nr:glycosyltransferase [Candidatus Omnitrophota bacterium]
MNILFITKTFPYPLRDGVKIREFNILNNLAKDNIVKLVCLDNTHLRVNKIINNFNFKLSEEEFNINLKKFPDADLIYLSGISVIRQKYLMNGKPILADFVDNPVLFMKRSIKFENNFITKIRKLKWVFDLNNELKDLSKVFKNFVFISEKDASTFSKYSKNTNTFVLPNGVDADFFKPLDSRNTNSFNILFTGVMNYPPNDDAARYFITSIFSKIKKDTPEVSFTIVGKNPSTKLLKLAKSYLDIEVTGYVDDARPYFNKAAVFVSPLRWGAGMKNKILEAWAMQKPVVASPISCEGLAAKNNVNTCIANTTSEFADKVIELFKDRVLAEKLAKNGRSLIENHYTWEVQIDKLSKYINKFI